MDFLKRPLHLALWPLALAACTVNQDLLTAGMQTDTGAGTAGLSSSDTVDTASQTSADIPPVTTTDALTSTGTDTGVNPSASDTDPSDTDATDTAPTDTDPTDTDPTDTTGDTAAEDTDAMDTDFAEEVDLLAMCDVDEPCPEALIDPIFMDRAEGMKCMWPLLRDGAAVRLFWGENAFWLSLGDPARTVYTTIQEGSMDTPVSRCTLAPPSFFADCIETFTEKCMITGHWIDDCVSELAPMCPAP